VDAELAQRLSAGASPFDGFTLSSSEMLPIAFLVEVLAAIQETLGIGEGGRWLFDRHEADGVPTESKPVDEELLEALIDSGRLYQLRSGQALVSLGLYPSGLDFYLRTYVMNEDEDEHYPGICGDFDLSGPELTIARVRERLASMDITLDCEPTSQYFARRAAA